VQRLDGLSRTDLRLTKYVHVFVQPELSESGLGYSSGYSYFTLWAYQKYTKIHQ
jgi:hypothetical protein